MSPRIRIAVWSLLTLCSAALLAGAWFQWLPLKLDEVCGFITGAVCVLLVVEQNIWNFPVGLANCVVFAFLFYESRLFGDMALQFVYIGLNLMGWWEWLHGGRNHGRLSVSGVGRMEALLLLVGTAISTAGLTLYFQKIGDSAPFLDALTTMLSLAAQYLLNMKRIESWFVWIAADVLYVFLYCQRELFLTAILYAVFLLMCVAGYQNWLHSLKSINEPTKCV